MEVFGARPDEPTVACLDEIQRCDLFVGIYAHRCGYLPAGSERSVTEQEVDRAHQLSKPISCFVIDEGHPWLPRLVEGEPGRSKLMAFKERVGKLYVRDSFTTPDDLGLKVGTAVGRHVSSAGLCVLGVGDVEGGDFGLGDVGRMERGDPGHGGLITTRAIFRGVGEQQRQQAAQRVHEVVVGASGELGGEVEVVWGGGRGHGGVYSS